MFLYCFFSLKDFDPYNHYAACCVPLKNTFKLSLSAYRYSKTGDTYSFVLDLLFLLSRLGRVSGSLNWDFKG